jgi:outer membrane lipoprotein SlyB
VLVDGGYIVVGHAHYAFGPEHFECAPAKSVKSLRTGYLVAVKPVNVELGRPVWNGLYGVGIPYFIEKGFRHNLCWFSD